MKAVRAFSFTASITPVLLGSALAFYQTGTIHIPLMFAAVVGGLVLHAATNLISDYFDYIKGVDREETLGGSRLLVEKQMRPKDVLWGGIVLFSLAVLIGIYLLIERGFPIVAFGVIGIVGGYFYTAGPLGYKYHALGEFLVFALMGPMMVWGGHFVQVGHIEWLPLLISIPVGILVAAILFANNLRDIEDDTASGFHTQASLMGRKTARIVYGALLFTAYASVAMMVIFRQAPSLALLVLLSIPAAYKVNKIIQQSLKMKREHYAMVDVLTAQLHFMFGILLTIGFVLGHFFDF